MASNEEQEQILEPGRMRDRVTIQRPVATKSLSGADIITWTDYLTNRAANVGSPKARKFFGAGRMQVEKEYPVEMWYEAGIDETMRMMFDGRPLEILTVKDPEARHRKLYLQAREIL